MTADEFLKQVGRAMTCRLTRKDAKELRYYVRGSKRLVVYLAETLMPKVYVGNTPENLEHLKALGVQQVKRPKPYKSTPPLYD